MAGVIGQRDLSMLRKSLILNTLILSLSWFFSSFALAGQFGPVSFQNLSGDTLHCYENIKGKLVSAYDVHVRETRRYPSSALDRKFACSFEIDPVLGSTTVLTHFKITKHGTYQFFKSSIYCAKCEGSWGWGTVVVSPDGVVSYPNYGT